MLTIITLIQYTVGFHFKSCHSCQLDQVKNQKKKMTPGTSAKYFLNEIMRSIIYTGPSRGSTESRQIEEGHFALPCLHLLLLASSPVLCLLLLHNSLPDIRTSF